MNLRYVKRLVPVIVVAGLITTSAFAKSGAKSEKKVTLNQTAALNGAAIPAGSYSVTWSADNGDPTVTFVKGKETVATAQAKWEDRDTKYEQNQVLYSNNSDGSKTIIEIRFAGMNRALVFGDSAS
ncbi:MAG TPA: hypothetical protein VMT20_28755 [Terriglobia bacterium]|nr:hypothetical protein [Terriglobia bacterium]